MRIKKAMPRTCRNLWCRIMAPLFKKGPPPRGRCIVCGRVRVVRA